MNCPPKNIAASVRQRLLNLARERGEDFQSLLIRYGAERLLYRLGRSSYRDCLVLKGATLFSIWMKTPYRATRDLDFEGRDDDSLSTVCLMARNAIQWNERQSVQYPLTRFATGADFAVSVSSKASGTISGVNSGSGAYRLADIEGSVQPTGTFVIEADGSCSFDATLHASVGAGSPSRVYSVEVLTRYNAGYHSSAVTVTPSPGQAFE